MWSPVSAGTCVVAAEACFCATAAAAAEACFCATAEFRGDLARAANEQVKLQQNPPYTITYILSHTFIKLCS